MTGKWQAGRDRRSVCRPLSGAPAGRAIHVCFAAIMACGAMAVEGLREEPLATRSSATGTTMFTELAADQTGLVTTNHYDDPRMWGELYRELTFGAMGTGVAVGDYDNDGRPDIFVVSKTETSRLFRNLGNWRFDDVTESAGLTPSSGRGGGMLGGLFGGSDDDPAAKAWEQGAAFADIDNDGDLDLYICRHGAANLLYVNRGDGTFAEEAGARGLAVVDGSGMANFADFDRDGWLDVYVQTNMMDYANHPDGRRDYLYHNNGDGTFADVTTSAGIRGETAGHSATWCDFDGDGWLDLWVANDFATPDQYYRNNGDCTFTDIINRSVPHMSYYSMGADFADVNNDGRFDLLVADMAATAHEKDQRTMAGSRLRGQKHDESSPVPPQYMRNALYLNTGAGRFREAANLAGLRATDWTWSLRFEDFDNDGRVDLHVTNGMNREYHGADLLERIMISENPGEPIRIMRDSPVLEETNFAFRNNGDLRFDPVGEAWGLAQTGVSFGAATGDFDGDGDLDLVYGNYQRGVSVFRNDAPTGQRAIVALQGRHSNRSGIGAVVRLTTNQGEQLRQLVPARGYLSSSEPIVHFGLGASDVIERMRISWPSGHEQVFTDLPAGRRFVVTEPEGEPPLAQEPSEQSEPLFGESSDALGLAWPARERLIEEPNGQPLLYRRFNRPGPRIAMGDLNADGRSDLVVGGTSESPPRILIARESGGFVSAAAAELAGDEAIAMGPLLLFDADGDGRDDLLVTKTGANARVAPAAYRPTLFLNRNGFSAAPSDALPALSISAGAIVAGDIDHDGDEDVFIGGRNLPGRYPHSPVSVLLRNDGGRFTETTDPAFATILNVGMVTAAEFADLDDDGWDDLIVATEWGAIRYFHNDSGHGFTDWTERAGFAAAGAGWWSSLAVGDFNSDGRLDVAAGNVGLNTPYHASVAEPAVLVHGNFSRRSRASPVLIEAYYESGRLFPRRERKDLAAQIRSLQRKFRRTVEYASATLEEIVGVEALANADRWDATEFRSGVLLSSESGRYEFKAAPRIAQIAPWADLAVGDFNADGHEDIFAVQNDHGLIELVGRFDGGLGQLLTGNGAGNFTAIEPSVSGLVVDGNAQAVVPIDLDDDGRLDLFVTRNQAQSRAFVRRD